MEIFEAAKAGKVSDVERLLDAFWPPEVKKRYELTALEVAVQHGQFRVMRQLLDRMRQRDDVAGLREGVALHLAAKHGHKNVANYLRICADLHSTALGGRTPLMWASSEGHLSVVQKLLYYVGGEDIDAIGRDYDKFTALHYAAANGHEEVVKLLLKRGADAGIASGSGMTALSSACEGGHLDVVQLLLDHQGVQALGMSPGTRSTPLHHAASEGREDVVKFLLGKGANANTQCGNGWTAFTDASMNGHVGVARILLEHMGSEDVDPQIEDGGTALFHAASEGHEDMVAFLLSKGASATIKRNRGLTPLTEASMNGHVGVARILVEHMGREDVNTQDDKGKTALFHAASEGHEDMVAFLLSKGASATIKSNQGLTPLTEASMNGHVGVARILVEHMGREDVNTQDDKGKIALHHGASNEDMVALLLSKGANASIQDENGRTPLMEALRYGTRHVKAAWLLLEHMGGEGVDTRDGEGKTALFYAADKTVGEAAGKVYEDMVAFLLSKGASATIKSNRGLTPLMEASGTRNVGLARLLLEHVGDQGVNTTNNEGKTALHHAATLGREEMVTFLLSKGADPNTTALDGRTALACASDSSQWSVVLLLAKHMGRHALETRDSDGRTPLNLACGRKDWGGVAWARRLLLAGADPTTRDNRGRRPPGFKEDVLPWWEGELERRYLLHRARALQDAGMRLSPVPSFLEARVATGQALPRVEIVGEGAGAGGKRKRAPEPPVVIEKEPWRMPGLGEDERHAMLQHVVSGLNDQLFTDLLQALHAPRDNGRKAQA